MSNYTFTFKKDNIVVDFTTTDKEVVERQFRTWVDAASEYAKSSKSKPKENKVAELVKPVKEEKLEASVQSSKLAELEMPKEQKNDATAQPSLEPINDNQVEQEAKAQNPDENTEVFEKASSLLKTINSIQEDKESSAEEVSQEQQAPDFEKVLEKSLETSTFEPVKAKDPVFLNLINSKNTTDKFHYLMITSFYLSEFEKLERFSLKQINAKLMQNLSEVIDHSMLQEAINQNFLELVPDLTGASDVAEYRLTSAGEEFFANRI